MNKSFTTLFLLCVSATIALGQTNQKETSYLNQEPLGLTPEKFAAGLISTPDEYEFGSFLPADAQTFYYAVRLDKDWNAEIRYTQLKNGQWTKPKRVPLDGKYSYNDPLLSEDGNRLYFMSNHAEDGGAPTGDSDLWYAQKTANGWSEPINLGAPVNSSKNEYYLSFAADSTLYFSSNRHTSEKNAGDHDIHFSRFQSGTYQQPVKMGPAINSKHFEVDAYVAPDQSYLIYSSSRPGGLGEGDLYISFKQKDGSWSKAQNMGTPINSENHEFCPFVTRDGRYFFYTSNGDIYWVSSKIIKNMKKESSEE